MHLLLKSLSFAFCRLQNAICSLQLLLRRELSGTSLGCEPLGSSSLVSCGSNVLSCRHRSKGRRRRRRPSGRGLLELSSSTGGLGGCEMAVVLLVDELEQRAHEGSKGCSRRQELPLLARPPSVLGDAPQRGVDARAVSNLLDLLDERRILQLEHSRLER